MNESNSSPGQGRSDGQADWPERLGMLRDLRGHAKNVVWNLLGIGLPLIVAVVAMPLLIEASVLRALVF